MAKAWYFDVLEVSENASKDEIMQSFRLKAAQYHPDKNPSPFAKERMQELNAAKDKALTALKSKTTASRSRDYRGTQARYRTRNKSRGPANRAQSRKGTDVHRSVSISLRESYYGGKRVIRLKQRDVSVLIPQGAKTGDMVRVAGQGQPGTNGGSAGNLLVTIQVEDDPVFDRDGDDLHITVQLAATNTARGTAITIVTIKDRTVYVRVPAGIRDGKKLRLRGLGMPTSKGGLGDMLVTIQLIADKSKANSPGYQQSNNVFSIRTEKDLVQCMHRMDCEVCLQSDIALSAPLPTIKSRIRVNGNGYRISGSNRFRAFTVGKSGTLIIEGLALADGKAAYGGSIKVTGALETTNCSYQGNSAERTGGAIWNTGTLKIANCTFEGNTAAGSGGAIISRYGNVTIEDCEFVDNTSQHGGGAIDSSDRKTTIEKGSFIRNTSGADGGAIAHTGEMEIHNSKFSHNLAEKTGGAIFNQLLANLSVMECEFVRNSARTWGGAIHTREDALSVRDCKFSGNKAKTRLAGKRLLRKFLRATANASPEVESVHNISELSNGAIDIQAWSTKSSFSNNFYSHK